MLCLVCRRDSDRVCLQMFALPSAKNAVNARSKDGGD